MTARTALGALRDRNRSRIAMVVRENPDVTHTDLVESTGLAEGVVSQLVNELVSAGVLQSETAAVSGRGRPRRLLRLDDQHPSLIGVSVRHDAVCVRLATLAGRTLVEHHEELGETNPTVVGEVIARAITSLAEGAAGECSLAIAFPGIQQGDALSSEEMLWGAEPISAVLAPIRAAGVRVCRVINDGSASTLAESRAGAAVSFQNVVVVLIGNGVGGDALANGDLLLGRGAPPGFGHTPVDRDGRICVCGRRGCLELFASLGAISSHLDERSILEAEGPARYAADLAHRSGAGEKRVRAILDQAQEWFAAFGDIISAVLGSEAVVITGPGAPLTTWLSPPFVGVPPIPVLRGVYGSDAPAAGALIAAQEQYLAAPLSFRGLDAE